MMLVGEWVRRLMTCFLWSHSLSLLIGKLPVSKIEDPYQFMLDRINTGSYASIVGGHRIQQNMIEILRGLLADDLAERWPLSDVELWANGRRMTPKQAKLPTKAARPLPIAGFDHENKICSSWVKPKLAPVG